MVVGMALVDLAVLDSEFIDQSGAEAVVLIVGMTRSVSVALLVLKIREIFAPRVAVHGVELACGHC